MLTAFRRWRAARSYDPFFLPRGREPKPRHGSDHSSSSHRSGSRHGSSSHNHHHSSHHHQHHHRHHHRGRHLFVTISAALFTITTLVLFFVVGLSIPIIHSVWLFTIHAKVDDNAPVTSIATQLRFGVWGLCAVSRLGFDECYEPNLGYSLTEPVNVASLIGRSDLVDGVLKGLTAVLVLHPICAALALIVFIITLFIRSHAMSIFALVAAVFLAIVGTIVLAIDIALVVFARAKVPDLTNDVFTVDFANGVWMVVGAVICSWLGVIALSARACLCFNMDRKF